MRKRKRKRKSCRKSEKRKGKMESENQERKSNEIVHTLWRLILRKNPAIPKLSEGSTFALESPRVASWELQFHFICGVKKDFSETEGDFEIPLSANSLFCAAIISFNWGISALKAIASPLAFCNKYYGHTDLTVWSNRFCNMSLYFVMMPKHFPRLCK